MDGAWVGSLNCCYNYKGADAKGARWPKTFVILRAFLLSIPLLSLGCNKASEPARHAEASTPQELTRAYEEALRHHDGARLHQLLSRRAQKVITADMLNQAFQKDGAEYEELEHQLQLPLARVKADAVLHYRSGFSVVLPYEQGGFKVPAEAMIPGSASTIEAALLQLTHALNSGSQSLVIAAHVKKKQVQFSAERDSLLQALQNRESGTISRQGLRASVELEAGHRVLLSFEKGRWRISEFH